MQSAKRGLVFGACLAALMAAGSVTWADASVSEDPRLDQKVTLSLGLVTLDKFAEEVSKQTGVTIEAGKNKKDWQVMERKTVVFAKDVPAKEILQQVAELHHYTLSGYGKGDKRYYRYWQDLKSRKEEEELREQDKTKPMEECASALDEMAKLENAKDKMTAEQLAKLEKDDPYKHFLLTDPMGQAMCGLAAYIPVDVWASSAEWSIKVGSADPDLRSAVRRYLKEMRKMYPESEKDRQPDSALTKIRFSLEDQPGNRGLGICGQLHVGGWDIHLLKPGSFSRELFAKVARAVRAGIEVISATPEQLAIKALEPLDDTNLKDDPILKQTVKIEKRKERDYAAWLQAIHEKTGLTVLSDSYWEQIGSGLSGELSVKDVLGRIAFFDKAISKENSTLFVSDERWYEKRLADIPDYYLEYYTRKAETSGLNLDDLKQIALDLNDEQINKNLLYRDLFKEYMPCLGGSQQLAGMRFLALLTPEQKSAMSIYKSLSNGSKLPAEELSADALEYALLAVGKDTSYLQGKRATFSEYNEPTPVESMQHIGLKLNVMDGQGKTESLDITVMTPGLRPPKDVAK